MYELIYSKIAEKQIRKLDKDLQIRILGVLERIRIRPYLYVKKLVGISGYRLRVGDYRVILDIVENKLMIFVVKVAHRKEVYKK